MEKEKALTEASTPDVMEITGTNIINSNEIGEEYDKISIEVLEKLEADRKKPQPKPEDILVMLRDGIKKVTFADNEKQPERIVKVVNEVQRATKELGVGIMENVSGTYIYVGSHWARIDPKACYIEIAKLSELMGVNHITAQKAQFIEDIGKQLSYSCYRTVCRNSENVIINLENGELNINKGIRELKPHNIDSLLTYVLPFGYDPGAECLKFQTFLDEVLPEKEAQRVIQEFIGYLFINCLKLEKLLLLYGSGANGKSVLVEIISAMLGGENVTNYSLENLTRSDGRYIMQIADKLVNICSDISRRIEDNGKLKLLASGEPIEARPLYKDPLIIENYAKLMFSLNELPIVTEHTHGYHRRFLIVPFLVEIPKEKQDKQLAKKIIKSELPGVLNWALDGLDRLIEQQTFSESESIANQLDEFRRSGDSVAMFVSENNYHSSVTEKGLLKTLYNEYTVYCGDCGNHPVAKKVFQERLARTGIKIAKSTGGMMYVWIEQREDTAEPEQDETLPF